MAKRRAHRDMTVEEFFDWADATKKFEKMAETADESGGPSLSLVPAQEQNKAWPTDLLPPADSSASGEPAVEAMPFDGIPLADSKRRLAGWSAQRQRHFLNMLAETGSVHLAANAARLSARSAYHLRTRSPAFAAAWNAAQQIAVGRLSAVAFDRALNGRVEQVYSEGCLIAEKRVPSDRLLTWLLARLDPRALRYALGTARRRRPAGRRRRFLPGDA
jgi:hypothetical protein